MAVRRFSTSSIRTGTKSSKFWDQSTTLSDFEWIATGTVTNNNSATFALNSIPGTYKHLQLRWSAGSYNNADFLIKIQFNTDTSTSGTNYSRHGMWTTGAALPDSDGEGNTHFAGWIYTANAGTDWFDPAVVDILDYSNTNKYKTVRFYGSNDSNGTGDVAMGGGMWKSTSAITSITLLTRAGNHRTNSVFSLYGIKE